MTDLVPFVAIVGAIGLVGIAAGMLVARALDRFARATAEQPEPDDDEEANP